MALMTLLSIAGFLGIRRLCAKARPRSSDAVAAGLVLLIGVYIRFRLGAVVDREMDSAAVSCDPCQLVSCIIGVSCRCAVVTDGNLFDSSQNSDPVGVDCCDGLVGDLCHPAASARVR